jgi:CheY-like chemotaxis protein
MTHTILVVDDETSLVDVLASVLEYHHYVVLKAHDGLEAVKVMQGNRIDLLITDYMMPRLDGIALYHYLRNEYAKAEDGASIPMIMMSALPDELDGLLLHTVLRKPFQLDELMHHVEGALNVRQQPPSPAIARW